MPVREKIAQSVIAKAFIKSQALKYCHVNDIIWESGETLTAKIEAKTPLGSQKNYEIKCSYSVDFDGIFSVSSLGIIKEENVNG